MRVLCVFAAASFIAAAGVDTPSIGYARVGAALVRVSGVSGALIVTPTDQSGIIAAAFSDRMGFVKTDATVRVVDAFGSVLCESEAPAGSAVFGFDPTGRLGVAWYVSSRSMAVYREEQWVPVPFNPAEGAVLAVALRDENQALAVIQSDQLSIVRIRLVDGAVEDVILLGSSPGPVLLLSDASLVYPHDGGIFYRNRAGDEQALALPNSIAGYSPMSNGWIQALTVSGRSLALRLTPAPRVYEIPEPAAASRDEAATRARSRRVEVQP